MSLPIDTPLISRGIALKRPERGHFVASNVAPGLYNISAVGAARVSSPVQALKIQGSKAVTVTSDLRNTGGAKTAAIGKKKTKFVWVPDQTASHRGGHWMEVTTTQPPLVRARNT